MSKQTAKVIVTRDTFVKGELVKKDDKPQSFDEEVCKDLIAAGKAKAVEGGKSRPKAGEAINA